MYSPSHLRQTRNWKVAPLGVPSEINGRPPPGILGLCRASEPAARLHVAAQVDFRAELDPARARVVLEEAGLLASVSPEPRPDEIPPLHRHISGVFRQVDSGKDRKARFKQMLTEAETDDEKRLALEIVLGERLRELKGDRANVEVRLRFERALGLLRNGNLGEALRHTG